MIKFRNILAENQKLDAEVQDTFYYPSDIQKQTILAPTYSVYQQLSVNIQLHFRDMKLIYRILRYFLNISLLISSFANAPKLNLQFVYSQ